MSNIDDFNGSNSANARAEAILDALRECDRMDEERKELAARHKAAKRLLISNLGVSATYFELLRKIEKLEHNTPGETNALFKDAFAALEVGQHLDWVSALEEQERPAVHAEFADDESVEIPPPSRRRGRPPGSKNRPRV